MSAGNGTAPLRILGRDQIVAAQDLARETLAVPEWGEDAGVLVQAMDVNRRLAYREFVFVRGVDPTTGARTFQGRDDINYNAVLAVLGIIDEAGEPVFTLADIELIGSKDPAPIERIGDAVARLSRTGKYAAAQADTPLALNGASPTALPVTSG